ncbi:sulfotransferase [Thiohalobacter sp. IOR34]|uniref:sulfotransferase family protein n=1 Tax=Thiohalobacter sp. IOR34 TaxID=3057176 RepID=UPI0025B026BC|nr:sulfotransferase [Thiohalobacter sp. IOR34]WJW75302.1 sulfotransferase [Thiohalobacter sp. IOR34]
MREGLSSEGFGGPLFIVGMPRSGTKLLRDLLNRHPRIAIPDVETMIFPYLVKNWHGFSGLEQEAGFHEFYVRMARHFFFEYLRKRGEALAEDEWRSYIKEYSPAGVFEALVRAVTKNPQGGNIIWGDKSPSYIEYIEVIAAQYPTARFVHIVRDVRDYCLSINKAWGKNKYRAAYRWRRGVAKARRAGQQVNDRYMEVYYESLLEDPPGQLGRICDFLGIDFVSEMGSLDAPSENLGDARGAVGIIQGNKNKYLRALRKIEIKKIEEFGFEGMKLYGYQPIYASQAREVSGLQRRLWHLQDGLSLAKAVAREHGLLRGILMHLRHKRLFVGAP